MRIIGFLLIVGALVGGGIILSDTIPGWMRNTDRLARTRNEAAAAQQQLTALGPNVSERAIDDAKRLVDRIRFDEESVARRRNETLLYGGGALAVLVLGTVLVVIGGRKKSQRRGTYVALSSASPNAH